MSDDRYCPLHGVQENHPSRSRAKFPRCMPNQAVDDLSIPNGDGEFLGSTDLFTAENFAMTRSRSSRDGSRSAVPSPGVASMKIPVFPRKIRLFLEGGGRRSSGPPLRMRPIHFASPMLLQGTFDPDSRRGIDVSLRTAADPIGVAIRETPTPVQGFGRTREPRARSRP